MAAPPGHEGRAGTAEAAEADAGAPHTAGVGRALAGERDPRRSRGVAHRARAPAWEPHVDDRSAELEHLEWAVVRAGGKAGQEPRADQAQLAEVEHDRRGSLPAALRRGLSP